MVHLGFVFSKHNIIKYKKIVQYSFFEAMNEIYGWEKFDLMHQHYLSQE
jgi:hypothetical protein